MHNRYKVFGCSVGPMLIMALTLLSACHPTEPQARIVVDLSADGRLVSDRLYGIFIEDINRAGDGRLYAELVQNRSFEDAVVPTGYKAEGTILTSPLTYNHVTGQQVTVNNRWDPNPVPGWQLQAHHRSHAQMYIANEQPYYATAPHYLHVEADGEADGLWLVNNGYGGMGLQKGQTYRLRLIARSSKPHLGLRVQLGDNRDNHCIVEAYQELGEANMWTDVELELTAQASTSDGQLCLQVADDWSGTLDLDYVSLMPTDTYHHRPNGMRRDVAEAIEALCPTFVRWPGGCVVEGITLETRFKWKEAMGDPASRPGTYNLWGYRNSCGLGWKEMLDFCEDLDAAAMYVCNVGMACQAQTSELAQDKEVANYLQDCLDAIEFAIGDTTTLWGARRAAEGHPEPYRLEYVEIGNENWGPRYDERYELFYREIKARYPQLTLISNYGLEALQSDRQLEYIDPHWYVAPNFFFNNTQLFDSLPRTGTSIYVGEYACNRSVGSGNMEAALSEAAFMLGMERNADLVKMCSYAPLLESDWYRAWPTNLIWVSSDQVMGRSSYYVQRLMAEHRPTRSLATSLVASQPELQRYPKGRLGLGCWKSEVEYRNARLSVNGADFEPFSLSQGFPCVGKWQSDDTGTLHQVAIEPRCKYLLPVVDAETYTLELQARKVAGKDAFIIYFGMDDEGQEGYYYSVGGQNNSKACVERMHLGENSGQDGDITSFHAEMDQWYDLRIEVSPTESHLYVDGQHLISHRPQTYALQVYAAGFDDNTGELILKAVNAADEPWTVDWQLNSLPAGQSLAASATVATLSAQALTDENCWKNPECITPQQSTCRVRNEGLTYTLAPHSLTIMRIGMKH